MQKIVFYCLLILLIASSNIYASATTKTLGDIADLIPKISNAIIMVSKDILKMRDIVKTEYAIEHLKNLSYATSKTYISQSGMLEELTIYIIMVEKNSYNQNIINKQWNEVAMRIQTVIGYTYTLNEMIEKYKSDFSNKEYEEYMLAIAKREKILNNLKDMQPPLTAEDISYLKKINQDYKVLVKKLRKINVDLNMHIEKLKNETKYR